MDKQILLGVVIPVYNGEKYLEQAVRSVLEQPCKDLIVVIVNDGSKDGSLEIAQRIAAEDSRVTVLDQQNQGVSAARNAGIECCLSRNVKYVGFLDADDLWVSGAIDLTLAEKLQQRDCAALYTMGTVLMSAEGDRFSHPDNYASEDIRTGEESIWNVKGSFAATLYAAQHLGKWGIRFNTELKYSEDKIFTMQAVFLAESVCFLEAKTLYIYRNNPSSAMSKVNAMRAVDYFVPIINGWLWSDDFLNGFQEQTGRCCRAGTVLAGIYVAEVVAESFKRLEKGRSVLDVIRAHPYYHLLTNMCPEDVSSKQYKDAMLLVNHPLIFECKYRMIGLIRYILLQMLRVPFVRKLRDKKRYPLTGILDL